MKHALGSTSAENEDLLEQIAQVEKKNRMLNERINEIIYNKATTYKAKTLDALKKGSEQYSPRGRRERAQQFGIPDNSEMRLNQVLAEERMTTDKALDSMQRMARQHSPLE